MEIIDMRSKSVDENIKTGDVLEVINPEDYSHEYWIVGYSEGLSNKGKYSLVNLETGVALLAPDLDSALKYYCLGCDIRVVDTELLIKD